MLRTIGEMSARFRVRELLEKADLTQSELARRAEVSFATVNRLCTNATNQVSLETLDKIAAVLGVEPGDLLERVPKKPRGRKD